MAKLVSSSLANLKIINKIFVYFNGHLKAIIPLFTLCITPLYFAYQQIVEKAEVGHILHINTEFPLIMTPNRNVVKKMIGSRKNSRIALFSWSFQSFAFPFSTSYGKPTGANCINIGGWAGYYWFKYLSIRRDLNLTSPWKDPLT